MTCLKKLLIVLVAVPILLAFLVSAAPGQTPGYSKKIVVFHEGVPWEEILGYTKDWEARGVSVVTELQMINGVVLKVPAQISLEELAADPRVLSVEENQRLRVHGLRASSDGGASDGGASDGGASDGGASDGGASDGGASDGGAWSSIPSWSFITPVVQPPRDHRHWGALKAYDQLRDPNLWTDYFDADEVPGVIRMALKEMQKKKIRIAVFDTGIDFTHPDLRGKAKAGCDITGTSGYPADDNGHGTHIAGTLISSLGLALPVELYSVKILDKFASGDLFNIVLALQWAIDHRMDIVNMSLSYRDDSFAVRSAVQTAFEHGLIMVAAVGNRSNWDSPGPSVAADGAASDGGASDGGASDGGASDGGASDGGASDGGASDGGASDGGASDGGASDGGAGLTSGGMDWYSVMYPARYPQVIAVGASTPWGDMAAFSNSGEEMDLTAPGVKIISTNLYKWGGFGICSGTSMATPHVSGAVAMMLALDPNLTATEIKDILRETSDPLGDPVGIGDLNLISALGSVWQTAIWEQKMRMVMKAETEDFDDGQGKRSNLASGENRK